MGFGHLVRMPPARLPLEVFWARPTERRPQENLAWEPLRIPQEELESVAGFLSWTCCRRDLKSDTWKTTDGSVVWWRVVLTCHQLVCRTLETSNSAFGCFHSCLIGATSAKIQTKGLELERATWNLIGQNANLRMRTNIYVLAEISSEPFTSVFNQQNCFTAAY